MLSLVLENATQLYCIAPKGRGKGTDAEKHAILGSNHTLMHMHKYILPPSYEKCNSEFEKNFIKSAILEIGSQLLA